VTAAVAVAIGLAGWLWPRLQPGPVAALPAAASAAPAASAALPMATALPAAWPDERALSQALLAAWGVAEPGAGGCEAARTAGLACAEARADAALLQRLDRPVGLDVGEGRWLLLQGLSATRARVQGSGGQALVDRNQLLSAWTGRMLTLWRPPAGWQPGAELATGDAADWALERLVALQGEAGGRLARQSRDEALRQRVFAFQVAQGLPLDGVAGPLTLMLLNRASGVDEPRLQEP
ncbi:MAG: peptidoglycan-binding protein, partial [Rubrivivax sp.]|nr:peptidoglycan-binding protein [Rubrivivax sp.]